MTAYETRAMAPENITTRIDFDAARAAFYHMPARSAWKFGVMIYARELFDDLSERVLNGEIAPDTLTTANGIEHAMLNGARNWDNYSWSGDSLIYDRDIATRLCAPWEYRKTLAGERRPNPREQWLDVQARALFQASKIVIDAIRAATLTSSETVTAPAIDAAAM